MKITMLCFSLTGHGTGCRLLEGLQGNDREVLLAGKSKYLEESIAESHVQWTKRQFAEADAIIFIGACGIAVRSIAPYVGSKKTDPAVLVVDECGTYVISLLSGHLGGANELTNEAAKILGAVPVVTTATDLHKRFAVDVFAKKNDCTVFPLKAAKEFSAALLAEGKAGFYSDYAWDGEVPEGLVRCDRDGMTGNGEKLCIGMAVTIDQNCRPFEHTVWVIPKTAALGMGCRKGKKAEAVEQTARHCMESGGIFKDALQCIASIDLKKEEAGLLALSRKWSLPFVTFCENELKAAQGDFSASDFVKQITGVDNVCERSAVLASGQGTLIQKKAGADGVTAALAVRDWRIHFE